MLNSCWTGHLHCFDFEPPYCFLLTCFTVTSFLFLPLFLYPYTPLHHSSDRVSLIWAPLSLGNVELPETSSLHPSPPHPLLLVYSAFSFQGATLPLFQFQLRVLKIPLKVVNISLLYNVLCTKIGICKEFNVLVTWVHFFKGSHKISKVIIALKPRFMRY